MTNRNGGVIEATSEPLNWTPPFAVPFRRTALGNPIAADAPVPTIHDCPFEVQQTAYFAALAWWMERFARRWQREEADDKRPLSLSTSGVPTMIQTNDTPARHMSDDPIPGSVPAKLEGRNQVAHNTCTQVRLFWRKSLGYADGYDLFLGKAWVHFPGPEWRIEEVLNPPLANEAERREVNWDIEWNAPGGRASLINLEDKGVAKKPIEQQIDEQHAEAVASRPASEWETFDKEDEALKPPTAEAEKPTYLGHTAVPDEAIHAIPNHIKRELALAPEKVGLHVRNALGTATPDYIGKHGVREAWDKALDYVAKVKADNAAKNGQQAASTDPSATGIPEKPSAPVPDEKPRSEPGNVPPDVNEDELPMKVGPHHYEPEFVVLFEMYDTYGKQERFTIKADDEFTGYRRKVAFQKFLRSEGYTDLPKREAAPAAQTVAPASVAGQAPAPAPAPTTSTGGVFIIREIQKVMLDGKTRYELYDAPGGAKPALIVRPQQMVKRLIAPHINVDAMTPGLRYGVNWQCTWTPGAVNPNSNQPFKDLSAVQPLAAA